MSKQSMSKRTVKTARCALWLASLALCCVCAFQLMKIPKTAPQPGPHATLSRDPDTTGSIDTRPVKICRPTVC